MEVWTASSRQEGCGLRAEAGRGLTKGQIEKTVSGYSRISENAGAGRSMAQSMNLKYEPHLEPKPKCVCQEFDHLRTLAGFPKGCMAVRWSHFLCGLGCRYAPSTLVPSALLRHLSPP